MQLPPYFLPRPPLDLAPATLAAFDRVYNEGILPAQGKALHYALPQPKWQFLCWLCDTHDILLHGSGDPGIEEFEPRKSNDRDEFGNRQAVYAASDGIWPLYFAVVDRERHVTSLINACFRVVEPGGSRGAPYYFFSVDQEALPHQPWRPGTIYVLPRAGFEPQPHEFSRGAEMEIEQWACLAPVRPLARLQVQPQDFPFLAQVRGHDLAEVNKRADADPEGFPWVDE